MIDDKVKQVHAELAARDKRNSLLVVVAVLAIFAASFFILRDYGFASVGKAVNLPDDARCTCTAEGCSGFLGVRAGDFLIGEVPGRLLKNSCATPAVGLQQQPTIIRLIGDSCAVQNNAVQFSFEGRINTFQSVCITDDFLTAKNSNKLAEFLCEGNNLKVRFEPCACADGVCGEAAQPAPPVPVAKPVPVPPPVPVAKPVPVPPPAPVAKPVPPPAKAGALCNPAAPNCAQGLVCNPNRRRCVAKP